MENKKNPNLPKTEFPMRAGLPTLEKSILSKSPWISTSDKNTKEIVHDGPPYANGDIHVGHAYNKILKDVLVRYLNLLNGEYPHYVCGWDCHGLPIELAVKKKDETVDLSDLNVFRKYASEQIEKQKQEFARLGIIIDHRYETMSSSFENDELTCFQQLVKKGFVITGNKPVHWCWSCETSLAESELEYANVSDNSVYVLFPFDEFAKGMHLLVWTTTPWTLKANKAIAFNKSIDYVAVELPTGQLAITSYYFAKNNDLKISGHFDYKSLMTNYTDPFLTNEKRAVFHADYVTEEVGTGLVHIAPSCGNEDYLCFTKTFSVDKSSIESYTDTKGRIDGIFYKKANKLFVEKLQNNSFLWKQEKSDHSYPHCWRCHNPTIQRATRQVFLEYSSKKDLILEEADKVNFFPAKSKNRFMSFILSRTEWCVSRQRTWGVPIPQYDCNDCLHSDFDMSVNNVEQWRNNSYHPKCSKCSSTNTKKGTDILDVWFDSGLTYRTLKSRKSNWIVEGSDQHRGWFQSSHILSCLLENRTCLKNVISHGFVLDEKGRKMSKSLGNVIDPLDVSNKQGAEILRLWTISQQVGDDVSLGEKTLEVQASHYKKIRNTLRYLHANLYDFDCEKNHLAQPNKGEMKKLETLIYDFNKYFEKVEYNKFLQALMNYLDELSSGYIDTSKEVLYESESDSDERRAIQATYYVVLVSLMEMLEVILPFTIFELQEYRNKEKFVVEKI